MLELAHFLDDDDDILPRHRPGKGKLDKIAVLKAVQDEQAVLRLLQRDSGIKLRLRARLEAEVITRAFLEIFLDDRAVLS